MQKVFLSASPFLPRCCREQQASRGAGGRSLAGGRSGAGDRHSKERWKGAKLAGDAVGTKGEGVGRQGEGTVRGAVIIISIFASFKSIFTPQTRSCLTSTREIGTNCDENQLPLATVEAVADLDRSVRCCSFTSTSSLICLAGPINFCKTASERRQT